MKKLRLLLLCLLALTGSAGMAAAGVDIPTGGNIEIVKDYLTNCNVENGGRDVGSTHSGSVIKIGLNNATEQAYVLSLLTGASGLTADYEVKVTDAGDNVVTKTTMHVLNTGSWTPSTPQRIYIPKIAAGTYTLTLTCTATTASYAGNLGSFQIAACDYDIVPGVLDIETKAEYNGPRYEAAGQNIGFVQNGGTATYHFYCGKDAYYKFFMDITRYSTSSIEFEITDYSAHETVKKTVEIPNVSGYAETEMLDAIHLSEGLHTMKMTFRNESGWVCNYKNPKWVFQAEKVASVAKMKVNGSDAETVDASRWITYLPMSYDEATTAFSFALTDGTVAVTAKDENDADVEVTAGEAGSYSIPTPAKGSATTVSIALTPNGDAVALQPEYTLTINHLGDILVKELYVEGIKIGDEYVEAINTADAYAATFANCFTQKPAVSAVINDGKTVDGTASIDGTKADYTLVGGSGDETRTFTLTLEGLHIYNKVEGDKSHSIAPGTGTITNNIWTDGQVTLNGGGDWAFKLKPGEYTLNIPANWKVKQVKFLKSADNYASTGYIASAASEGATVYVPFDTRLIQGNERDFFVNLDGHTPGADISFTLKDCSQATFRTIEFVYEEVAMAAAPKVTLSKVSDTTGKNHAVIALTFDHAVTEAAAECNGQEIKARGLGSTTLYFSTWDLEYSTGYTLTIPAGRLADAYGNKTAEDIEIAFTTGEKPVVDLSQHDFEVSTAAELREAVAAANATAERTVIFVKDGDYDLGTKEIEFTGKNIYVIGESREGVLIHGERDGISNPVFECRYSQDVYFENFTLRNDYDFRAETLKGVSVALRAGTHTVVYHVNLQANQDTFVSWDSGYLLECDIHGTVDFICGGGDYFFDKCNIIIENRAGNCITAPNTSEATLWGYVFQNCTVTKAPGADAVVDGGYDLGRPWQNAPRCAFLNTTFEVLPSDAGWRNMSNGLNTYFYEYGSKDKDGNALDLSKRNVEKCQSANGNYKPVLTEEQAAEFTMYNTLGGNDSWNPLDMFDNTGATDGISETTAQNASLKAQGAYNLAGQKVSADYKGIIIRGGRKFLSK